MNLGAYYATKPLQAVHGLGQPAEQTMADVVTNAMQTILQSVKPLGTFVPWAGQQSELDWKVVAPDTRYALYPVNAAILTAAERAAFGQPVGFVTVLSVKQLSVDQAAALFSGTPFEHFSTDAVFSVDDTKPAPTILFVYWGRLRADAQTVGSYAALDQNARGFGAQPAFPVYLPVPAGVSQPAIDFNLALRAQQQGAPITAAAASPLAPAPAVAPALAPSASLPGAPATGIGTVLIVLAVGGIAAYAGYRIVQSRKRRSVAA